MLVVPGRRIVWVNFDVTIIFRVIGPYEKRYYDYKTELVERFGKLLVYVASFP